MTATDERAALYRAILAAPKDDAPRLVYADWLEEYGSEDDRLRAEFIRLQVELAHAPPVVPWLALYPVGVVDVGADEIACAVSIEADFDESMVGAVVDYEMRFDDVSMWGDPAYGLRKFSGVGLVVGARPALGGEVEISIRPMRIDAAYDSRRHAESLRRRERQILNDCVRWWGWLRDVYHLTAAPMIADLDHCSEGGEGWAVRFRRGFVAEVRAPLQALLDHGPEIVKAHPVEKMVATDKEPLALGTGAAGDPWEGWFCWGDDAIIVPGEEAAGVPFDGDVPRRVLKAMQGRRIDGNPYTVYFPSHADAVPALHAATLAVCREEAAREEEA